MSGLICEPKGRLNARNNPMQNGRRIRAEDDLKRTFSQIDAQPTPSRNCQRLWPRRKLIIVPSKTAEKEVNNVMVEQQTKRTPNSLVLTSSLRYRPTPYRK